MTHSSARLAGVLNFPSRPLVSAALAVASKSMPIHWSPEQMRLRISTAF
jgi:hypothetical protein